MVPLSAFISLLGFLKLSISLRKEDTKRILCLKTELSELGSYGNDPPVKRRQGVPLFYIFSFIYNYFYMQFLPTFFSTLVLPDSHS